MNFDVLSPGYTIAILLIALWTLPWKGVALWKSAQKKQLGWFVAMLILNTFAILEITYIFFFQKKKHNKKNSINI